MKKPQTVRCVVSRRSRRTAGAAIAWVDLPAMSRQTSLHLRAIPEKVSRKIFQKFPKQKTFGPQGKIGNEKPEISMIPGTHTEPIAVASGVPGTRDVRGPAAEGDLVPVGNSGGSGYRGYGDPG